MGAANLSWREVFVGTGAAAVGAAAEAGIGIALMARSGAPAGAVEVEARGLPQLPHLDVMLYPMSPVIARRPHCVGSRGCFRQADQLWQWDREKLR